ncbi:MAG: response regulator, partial [Planctomycetota bacterium]
MSDPTPMSPDAADASQQASTDLRGLTVLVVDDNAHNRELLEAYLEELEVNVVGVEDGVSAMAHVEREPPDLILLDIMMPNMSGFQVCEKLKAHSETR